MSSSVVEIEVIKKITINYNPKRTRFRKHHRGRMKGISYRGNRICFGRYALQALEPSAYRVLFDLVPRVL